MDGAGVAVASLLLRGGGGAAGEGDRRRGGDGVGGESIQAGEVGAGGEDGGRGGESAEGVRFAFQEAVVWRRCRSYELHSHRLHFHGAQVSVHPSVLGFESRPLRSQR